MTTLDVAADPSLVPGSIEQRDHLVQVARELVPALRSRADQSERDRRLAEESVEAMRSAGLLLLNVPRRCGGHEGGYHTYLAVCAELARGDSAAAWIASIMGGGAVVLGNFDDQARADVFGADPGATVIGQLTPSGQGRVNSDGDYRISGRWMWSSGCFQTSWDVVSYHEVDDDNNVVDLRMALFPMSDASIEDSWYVTGMAGTNSNTIVLEDVVVPAYRTRSLLTEVSKSEHLDDEPMYRVPEITGLSLALLGPCIGMAEAAWDYTLATLTKGKGIAYSNYTDARQSPSTQLNLADARALLDSASLHVYRAADDMDRMAREGADFNDLSRARVRSDMAVGVTRLREAVDLMLNIGGASSFALANPIQRVWRDLETATRHGYINADIGRELYGRALLGLDPVAPSF